MDVSVRRSGQSTVTTAFILVACSTVFFLAGIGVGFIVWGPEGGGEDAPPTQTASVTPEPNANVTAKPADPGMQHLESLEEVWPARHLFIAIEDASLSPEAQNLLASLKPGGVVLNARNVQSSQQAAELVHKIKRAVALGDEIYDLPLIAADQEGGVANPLNLGTAPGAREIASRRDLEHARQVGKTYAEACVRLGVGVMLAPVLDIYTPDGPAQKASSMFGVDEKTVSAMGLWFASGVIEGGVIPVAKHYPGLGGVKSTSRQPLPVLNQDVGALAVTMYPFAEAAEMRIPGLLAGHVSVPALDKSDPPRPASLSPTMINTVLRDRWGYGGVILSDDIANTAVTDSYSLPDAAVEALASGCDAVIVSDADASVIQAICDRIESAVENGELARSALRESKSRLDGWQAWLRTPVELEGTLPTVLPEPGSAPPPQASVDSELELEPNVRESEIIYTVQAGDVLSRIAAKYDGVTIQDIIELNNLSNATIRAGQDLKIRVRETALVEAEMAEPEASPESNEADEPEMVEPEPEPPAPEPEPEAPATLTEYVVQSGDVLSRIAANHDVTTQQIMEWNNLENSRIRIGQKLIIGGSAAPVESEPEPAPEPEEVEPQPESPSTEMTEYVVQSGDVLSRIAANHDVTTQQILEWNNLDSTRLSIGQKLTIGGSAAPEESEPEPAPEPEEDESEPAPKPEAIEPEVDEPADSSGESIEYTVQSGDALSKIAAEYNVTTQQIMEWNDLASTKIRVGQTLTIMPSEEAERPAPEETTRPEPESETEPQPVELDSAIVGEKKHSVQLGETLIEIADSYGVSVADLISWNDLDPDGKLQAGRVLNIYVDPSAAEPDEAPEAESEDAYTDYVIQSGDSPLSIANQFGITPEELMRINGVTDVNTLRVGQTLRVPNIE